MGVCDILSPNQVSIANEAEGPVRSKADALRRLAGLLARGQSDVHSEEIERVLADRERLQSTGVGGGVAIPHGAIDRIERLVGAVLLCPEPIEFDAIDNAPVSILFAVIGPKRQTGEHLKALARVSRLLRNEAFRERLLRSPDGRSAFDLMSEEEGRAK
jgi:PTS system nitrogen regulatory IIA component